MEGSLSTAALEPSDNNELNEQRSEHATRTNLERCSTAAIDRAAPSVGPQSFSGNQRGNGKTGLSVLGRSAELVSEAGTRHVIIMEVDIHLVGSPCEVSLAPEIHIEIFELGRPIPVNFRSTPASTAHPSRIRATHPPRSES